MSKKLCSICKKELKKGDLDDIKDIVKKGKYICTKCGRVANKKKNICKPDKI